MRLSVMLTALAASVTLAVPAVAVERGQPAGKDVPNVLVVRVAEMSPEQGQGQDAEEAARADLLAMDVDLLQSAPGVLDVEALVRDCDALEADTAVITVGRDEFSMEDVPLAVRKVFEHAEMDHSRQLSWRVWTPIGTIGNTGFYGYSRYPSWGHQPSYHPGWGYYDGRHTYPYNYGHSRYYNGNRYYYYYRW